MNIPQFIRLVRPRTLTAAFSPVVLGAAYGATQFPLGFSFLESLLYTVLIFISVMSAQMAANIWNEYFDFKSGLDLQQVAGNSGSIVREGISPSTIKRYGYITTIVPLVLGLFLSASVTWWYLPIGALCILISILYSGGPKPISRTPFGELASGLAMGLPIIGITAYAWTNAFHWSFLVPGIPSTLLIGSIMMTNNLRDMKNDEAHGRRTLAILLGKDAGIQFLRNTFLLCVGWGILFCVLGYLPWNCILIIFSLVPATKVLHIFKTYADPVQLNEAMKFTSITCTLYHLFMSIGLWLG